LSELILFVLPTIFSLTFFQEYIAVFLIGILLLAAAVVTMTSYRRQRHSDFPSPHSPSVTPSRVPIISLFKGANMLLTCISILAIDFQVSDFSHCSVDLLNQTHIQIFPRKFGKTETYGISLMDIGAGTFVICSALTSNYARKSSSTTTISPSSRTLLQKIFFFWQKIVVLLLGVGRLVAVKALNYQEHTSEYGTHWNFFVTLFFIWLLTDCIHIICVFMKWKESYALPLLSLVTLLGYQYFLLATPLTDFIFNAPRISFLSHNREGILSLFGYVPLYLLTEWYSHFTFFPEPSSDPSPQSSNESRQLSWLHHLFSQSQFLSLCGGSLVIFCCYQLALVIQLPSRRLMNLSFVFLVLLVTILNLLLLYLTQFIFEFFAQPNSSSPSAVLEHSSHPLTLHLWNKHQLILFLIANLLTGGINLMFHTIHMSTEPSMIIIVSYVAVLVVLSWRLG
jgi:glucosaminylphosphatidylinositol acyltransferase